MTSEELVHSLRDVAEESQYPGLLTRAADWIEAHAGDEIDRLRAANRELVEATHYWANALASHLATFEEQPKDMVIVERNMRFVIARRDAEGKEAADDE